MYPICGGILGFLLSGRNLVRLGQAAGYCTQKGAW